MGVWFGTYSGLERQGGRCYDVSGVWILTPHKQERQRAEHEHQLAERLAAQRRALGMHPEQ